MRSTSKRRFSVRARAAARRRAADRPGRAAQRLSQLHRADEPDERIRARRAGDCRATEAPLARDCAGASTGPPGRSTIGRRHGHADPGRHGAAPRPGRVPGLRAHLALAAASAARRRRATSRATCPARRAACLGRGAVSTMPDDRDASSAAIRPTSATVDPDYITVAVGRDFADVTSTSGVFTRRRHRHACTGASTPPVPARRRARRRPRERCQPDRPRPFAYDPGGFWDEMFDAPGRCATTTRRWPASCRR